MEGSGIVMVISRNGLAAIFVQCQFQGCSMSQEKIVPFMSLSLHITC